MQTDKSPSKSREIARMVDLPEPYLELIDGPFVVALSTVMPDGSPQTTPVWCNRVDEYILINVMRGFRKEKNMRLNPHVSLLAYAPGNPQRNVEIRGRVVEMTEEGAVEHNDQLTRLYSGKEDASFFGDAVPAELQSKYTPVRVKIAPTHIRVEG